MKNTEVERKFKVSDVGELRDRLAEAEAERVTASQQKDVYYNHPARDFLQGYEDGGVISEWLRLRDDRSPDGTCTVSINFKQWLPLGAAEATHANEFESAIADRESGGALLEALGFTVMVTVDKRRELWHLVDVEVAVDDVIGLGTFVEFEYKGAGGLAEADAAISRAVKLCSGLLGERDRRGYPYLLLGK